MNKAWIRMLRRGPWSLFIVCSLIMLGSLGCNRTQYNLIGEWSVDQVALAKDTDVLKIAPPAGLIVQEWKKNMTSDWSFRFHSDQSLEMIMHGSHYEGRYQVMKEVGNTLYIRSEVRTLPINGLDALLGITQEVSKVEVKRFSIRITGREGTLKIDNFAPLKLLRQPKNS